MSSTTQSVVLLSGGVDSAVALALQTIGTGVATALFVDYDQPARKEEFVAAKAIAAHYSVDFARVEVSGLPIPRGEIPGRNAILALLAYAAIPQARLIILGTHPGSPYWDCSDDFVAMMQAMLDGYTDGSVQLLAPFGATDKGGIYALAAKYDVPLELTYSCEFAGGPCSVCLSCRDVQGRNGT